MDWQQIYVLGLGAIAMGLLAFEKAHLSVVGVLLIVGLAAPAIISPYQAYQGFANPAVITVAALYVVGEGFLRTGAASLLAERILARTGGSEWSIVILIMVMSATLSAFVNNILVVVTFMPVITSICRSTGLYPSRLLIPLSYASIVGGMCTLVGTSTNLLISGALEDAGLDAIGMFEMSSAGVVLAAVAMLYIALIGRHLLPKIPSLAADADVSSLHEYVTEISIGAKSSLIDLQVAKLGETSGGAEQSARVAMLIRGEALHRPPFGNMKIRSGDILTVSGQVQDLASLYRDPSHTPESDDERFNPSEMSFFELAPTPSSSLVGHRVQDVQLKARYGAVSVGMMRNGQHVQERVQDLRLGTGDVILAFGNDRSRDALRHSADLHLIEGVQDKIFRRDKAKAAIGVILAVVVMFSVLGPGGILHYSVAALIGALAMVLLGCLSVAQANRAVNWPILTFIAGTIALSKALQSSGAAESIGRLLADHFGSLGPGALLAAIYISTIVLTELLSNNAVALVMTPVALQAAAVMNQLGGEQIDQRLVIFAVAFGASTSFANPMGYKTNLLVFGPGGYRFTDFLKVGLGLDVLLGATGLLVLPWFW